MKIINGKIFKRLGGEKQQTQNIFAEISLR